MPAAQRMLGILLTAPALLLAGCVAPTGIANLKSLAISPNPGSVAVGGSVTFTVTATLEDGTQLDATSLVDLASSDVTVAELSVDPNAPVGTFTGLKAGSVTITASDPASHIDATAPLTVGSGACTVTQGLALSPVPFDEVVMFSQAASMSGPGASNTTKWQDATGALNQFASQSGLQGVSIGLQFFGLPLQGVGPTQCYTDADCGAYGPCIGATQGFSGTCGGSVGGDSCLAGDYQQLSVEISAMPAGQPAIGAAVDAHAPESATATSAALQGAISHAQAWGTAHPGHQQAVVLVQSAAPDECDTSLGDIETIAAQGLSGSPSVRTFVLSVGAADPSLDAIASAGGTSAAFVMDTTSPPQASGVAALNQILLDARACRYAMPTELAGVTGLSMATLHYYRSSGAALEVLDQISGRAACGNGGGWYFDDASAPTEIDLCPGSGGCGETAVSSDAQIMIYPNCGD